MSKAALATGGVKPLLGREQDDFYATDPKVVHRFLKTHYFGPRKTILEPAVGAGHIANVLPTYFPDAEIRGTDIVDRGYPNVKVKDFLKLNTNKRFDLIISNPPFSLAREFVEKSLELCAPDGSVAMLLKIQFLEGLGRRGFFMQNPPSRVYVSSSRMDTWRGGAEVNPLTGKRWATAMMLAWFVWEKKGTDSTTIHWLEEM